MLTANPYKDGSTTCKPRTNASAVNEATRAGKRQAAPFAKRQPKPNSRKPGRKPGKDYATKAHREPPSPEQIDEIHEAQLPECCPDCGGPLDETNVAQQFQVEIPRKPIHRQFLVVRTLVALQHGLPVADQLGVGSRGMPH